MRLRRALLLLLSLAAILGCAHAQQQPQTTLTQPPPPSAAQPDAASPPVTQTQTQTQQQPTQPTSTEAAAVPSQQTRPDAAPMPPAMPVLTPSQPPASTMPAVAPVVTPSAEMPVLTVPAPAAAVPVVPASATPSPAAVEPASPPTPTPSHPSNLGPGSDMAAVLAAQLAQQNQAVAVDATKQKDASAVEADRLAARRAAMQAQTRERQQREADRAAVLAGQAARAAQAAAAAQAAQAAAAEASTPRPSTRVGTLGSNGPLGQRGEGRAGGGGGGGGPGSVGYAHEGHVHASDPDTTLIQHGGHSHTVRDAESHSGLIFGSMLGTMVLAQLGLFLWKKYHLSSFDKATLAGLWLFPMGYSVWHGVLDHWRMLSLWVAFSVACIVTMRKALQKPIARSTPREVYQFFTVAYRISYATAFAGYLIIMAHFLGLSRFPLLPSPQSALTLLFYGLYFGVLGRDLANVCSTSLALSMGYSARRGEIPRKAVPVNVCAICDGELIKSFRPLGNNASPTDAVEEKTHTLNCGHCFHDFCLRGWTMIGKRDCCASCSEKVVLKQTLKGPWETPSLAWAVLLDALRYLIVFNPVVLVLAQLVLYVVY